MRNLKKILALVLALVMSLSLMATAGAASFPDVDDDNPYATAIEVLDALKVFQGYKEDGTFRPDGKLNRAQAAVLVYRIATGDAEDKQVANYTEMANSQFTDLEGYNWAKGYINYCQNAKYVIGTSATTFDPGSDVTGYQLLVMLLRVLGYGQAGEFSNGRTWELETAKIAEREGILKNITTGDLGAAAPRAMVAEILFRGLLTDTVQYSIMTPDGYTKGETLGMREFKLEEIEGVVTGNEFADLKSTQVLDEGQTQLQTEDGLRDLAISTKITDIGESRYAYITGTKVLAMGDTGKNKVTETGAAVNIDTTSRFNATAEMPAASDIEYYTNFGRTGTVTCDQRLEFVVEFDTTNAYKPDSVNTQYGPGNVADIQRDFERIYVGGNDLVTDVGMTLLAGPDANNKRVYSKIIRAEADISDLDLAVIRGIFAAADNTETGANTRFEGVRGDVFVGTFSSNATNNEERDLSNQISYKKFVEDYINDEIFDRQWTTSENGYWVKFVDNDGDGQCDYAFRTWSRLDEAIDTYTNKDGDTVTQFITFNDDDTRVPNGATKVRYMNGEAPAVGDKVICAWIDNQILVEPANDETVTVTDYNWKDDVITTDKGEYGQSGIENRTDMQGSISTMDSKTQYIVYFDHFGYVRAYELPGGTQYTLITEIYAKNNQNGNLAQSWPMTVELVNKDADAAEYNLNGGSRSPFVSRIGNGLIPWNEVASLRGDYTYYNYLQPATAHYGVSTNGFAPTLAAPDWYVNNTTPDTYRFWTRNNQINKAIDALDPAAPYNDVFDYGEYIYDADAWHDNANNGVSDVTVSYTNVAVTNINDDSATLTGAAQLRRDRDGNILYWTDDQGARHARYAVDYVQLTKADTVSGQTRYPIDKDNYTGWVGNADNNYVSATHNTEYYIVYNGGVYYFTDYTKMPKLTMADNEIRAAYAVAHDTSADNASQPYWVADVIVYEVKNWDDSSKTSTALVYYNPSRNDNQVQLLETLDNKNDPTMVNVVPDPDIWTWGADRGNFAWYSGLGFYQLWDGEKQENGNLAVSDIVYIDGVDHSKHSSTTPHADGACGNRAGLDLRWNSNLIYAGTVVNEVDVGVNGTYLNVDTDNDGNTNVSVLIKNSDSSNVYSVTTDQKLGSSWTYNEAAALRYNDVRSSEIKAGDRIVWISNGAINATGTNDNKGQSAAFVVDLGNDIRTGNMANMALRDATPNFLYSWTETAPGSGIWNPDPISTASVGLWQRIMAAQKATPDATGVRYQFNVVLGDWETAEVSVNGTKVDTVECKHDSNAPLGKTVTARVPNGNFQVTIKVSSTDSPKKEVNVPGIYTTDTTSAMTLIDANADGTVKTYAMTISLTGSLLSADDPIMGSATVITDAGLGATAEFINDGSFSIGDEFNAATKTVTAAQAEEIAAVIADVKSNVADDDVTAALGTAEEKLGGQVLTAAKEAAAEEIAEVLSDEDKNALSETAQDAVEAAKATYDDAIAAITEYDETTQNTIDEAVAAYTTAVNKAKALDVAQTTAKTEVNNYAPEGFTEDIAAAVAEAKADALAAIDDATVETYEDAIPEAVAAYEQAVDDAIAGAPSADAVAVSIQGTNVTVAADQAEIKKGDYAAVINLECPAGGELPAKAVDNDVAKVQIRMVGRTLAAGDWTYARDAQDTTKATITFGFSVDVTGDITVGISATGEALGALTNMAVSDEGAIAPAEGAPAGSAVAYYVAAANAKNTTDTWTKLTNADDVAGVLGTAVADDSTVSVADNDKKLFAVATKDGKVVAIGVSDAIAVGKTTVTIVGNADVTSDATGGKIDASADVATGVDLAFNISKDSDQWVHVTEPSEKWTYTFSFTLSAGFVAVEKSAVAGVAFDPETNTVTVTATTDPTAGSDVTYTVTVKAPSAN